MCVCECLVPEAELIKVTRVEGAVKSRESQFAGPFLPLFVFDPVPVVCFLFRWSRRMDELEIYGTSNKCIPMNINTRSHSIQTLYFFYSYKECIPS